MYTEVYHVSLMIAVTFKQCTLMCPLLIILSQNGLNSGEPNLRRWQSLQSVVQLLWLFSNETPEAAAAPQATKFVET